MWYFHNDGATKSAGYPFDRLQNQRKVILKGSKLVEQSDTGKLEDGWQSEREDENPEADDEILNYLNSNMTASDIRQTILATVFKRTILVSKVVQDFDTRHQKLAVNPYRYWVPISKLLWDFSRMHESSCQ